MSAIAKAGSSILGSCVKRQIAVKRIERRLGQRLVRPFGDDWSIGKSIRRREGGARIDDRHVKVRDSRDRRERLRDVHGPDKGEPRRRRLNGEKIFFALMRDGRAFARAQSRLQLDGEGIGAYAFGPNESLLAVGKTGYDGAGAPLAARRIHGLEDIETHQVSFST